MKFWKDYGWALSPAGWGASKLLEGPEAPQAPQFELPEWAQGLPQETLDIIRSQIGAQLPEPTEYGISSEALQQMLGYQPEQFQLPISDIQQALAAQQQLQLGQYQKQIRPMLAQQGQLDSSYYTNLLGEYLQGQQAQTYGTTADLLTQQALQNLQTQKWLPQFQAGLAGQLAGLGGQRAGIGQFNLQLPFQTTVPALQNMYQTGLGEAGQRHGAAMVPYQQQMTDYRQQQQQQQQMMQMLGQLGMSAATGGIGGAAGLYGTGVGAGQGALYGLSGYSPQMAQFLQNIPSFTQSYRYNPQQYGMRQF